MGAAAAALLAVPISHGAVIAVSFVYGGMAFTVYGLSVAHMNDHLPPGEVLEATRGLLLVYGAGATLGPTVAGLLGLYALRRTRVSPPVPPEEQRAYVPLARVSPEALGLYPEAAGPTHNAPARQGT